MIQDIFPRHFNNQYKPDARTSGNDFVVAFKENAMLLRTDDENKTIGYPKVAEERFFLQMLLMICVCCLYGITACRVVRKEYILRKMWMQNTE